MADPADIASALLARVATLSVGSPALPIAYPDRPFNPPADGKYLEASVFFNRPAWEGLTTGRMDQGLLQVTVVWPKGQGIPGPMRHAADVMAHFPKALTLTNGVKVSAQPYAASPILDGADTRIPITISWTAI
tara:strand:+ start:3035 stop:3433 length:399 start_codon:yes stop_codon:yes gene_type:complete